MDTLPNSQGYSIYLLGSNDEISKLPSAYDAVIVQDSDRLECYITVTRASKTLSPWDIRQAFAIPAKVHPIRSNNLCTFTARGNLSHVGLAL